MNLISENTGITIGLVITACGAIWWAATMQTKMDILIGLVKDATGSLAALVKRVDKVELDVAILQQKDKDKNG